MPDSKYGTVTVTRKGFYDDEPLFILRAKDQLAPAAVEAYASLLRELGMVLQSHDLLNQAEAAHGVVIGMRKWQRQNENIVRLPT